MKPYRSSSDAYDMLMSRVAHKKNIQAAAEKEEEEVERKKVCYALHFAIHVHHLIHILPDSITSSSYENYPFYIIVNYRRLLNDYTLIYYFYYYVINEK
jgi:hypothetical protein